MCIRDRYGGTLICSMGATCCTGGERMGEEPGYSSVDLHSPQHGNKQVKDPIVPVLTPHASNDPAGHSSEQASASAHEQNKQDLEPLPTDMKRSSTLGESHIDKETPPTGLQPMRAKDQDKCWYCNAQAVNYCRGCRQAQYCSRAHQITDWEQVHNQECDRTFPKNQKVGPCSCWGLGDAMNF
eukprot:TRINITY_DN15906_c0_g1_i1.p1 TRINITY_DN15906_c0_g1~~TRINITY_DN15906_c0_g1_i1.p1  ORF type:complete len:183 (+),score=18.44 TRINITY_DN15906_c0_g1_i1:139-687(+)